MLGIQIPHLFTKNQVVLYREIKRIINNSNIISKSFNRVFKLPLKKAFERALLT